MTPAPEPHISPAELRDLALALALAAVLVALLLLLQLASKLKGLLFMDTTFGAIVASLVRHGLTLAGGFLVAKGVITDAQSAEFVGLGLSAAAYGWSVLQKHDAGKKLKAALDR
jgi:hypothetical protein